MAKFSLLANLGLNSKAFQKGLKKSESSVKKFQSAFTKTMARVAGAFVAVGLGKQMIQLSMDAEEVASKFNEVLGPSADRINQKIGQLMKTIPATRAELQNSVATIASMAQAFGMSDSAAADFSLAMTKISGDLASFHNMRPEEVFDKIAAAITGEFEPLKRLGIVINEARLKQEALNLGIGDGTSALNAQQKAIAVQNIILKDMGAALGNAALTSESAANQAKFLKQRITELKTEIGNKLRPAVVKTMEVINKFTGFVADNLEVITALTKRIFAYIAAKKAIALVIPLASKALVAYRAAAAMAAAGTSVLTISMKFLKRSIQGLIGSTGIGLLVVALGELGLFAMDAATKTGQSADSMSDAMTQAGEDIADTMALVEQSTTGAISGMTNLSGSIDGVTESFRKSKAEIRDFNDRVNAATRKSIQHELKVLELKKLQAKMAGDNTGIKKLDEEIKRQKEILHLIEKFNISLVKASMLRKQMKEAGLNVMGDGEDEGTGGTDGTGDKPKSMTTGGISSLAAIGGGGRIGALKPLDEANSIAREQLGVMKEIRDQESGNDNSQPFK